MVREDFMKMAAESRVREIDAAINRFRDCGVEIERFSIREPTPFVTVLCVDRIPRFTWRIEMPGWDDDQ